MKTIDFQGRSETTLTVPLNDSFTIVKGRHDFEQ